VNVDGDVFRELNMSGRRRRREESNAIYVAQVSVCFNFTSNFLISLLLVSPLLIMKFE
jgi:hypothetical protein